MAQVQFTKEDWVEIFEAFTYAHFHEIAKGQEGWPRLFDKLEKKVLLLTRPDNELSSGD